MTADLSTRDRPHMTTLGIDIGGTSTKVASVEHGICLATAESPRYERPDAVSLRAAVAVAIENLRTKTSNRLFTPAAIGLCLPGARDPDTGIITHAINVPGLIGQRPADLAAHAAEVLNLSPALPHTIVSDAHAAAYAHWSTAKNKGRLFALSLGTGVGACVLDDGLILKVSGESSGHFGQIDVSLEDIPTSIPVGPDGGRGSLEAYLGLPALRAHFGPRLRAWLDAPSLDSPPIRALVRALRIAHAIYRPHSIVLLGGVGMSLAPILTVLRARVNDHLTILARPDWKLEAGTHRHYAAVGAALLANAQ